MARISEIIDSKTLRGTSGKESASAHANKVHIVLRILPVSKPVGVSENGVSGVKRGWGHGLVAESARGLCGEQRKNQRDPNERADHKERSGRESASGPRLPLSG